MIRLIKKYSLLLFYIFLSVWTSLASTPLIELFRPPLMLSRIYSALLYVPFAALILWKLIGDIREFRKNAVNLIYYLFAFYYGILCVYRFAAGMEFKESLYYSVVLFGSVALYCQIRDDRLHMDRSLFKANFTAILIFMSVYKIIASALCVEWFGLPRLIGNTPINNLYSTSMLVLLIPFLLDSMRGDDRKKPTLDWLLLTVSLILIYLCSSRAIFILATVYFAICARLYCTNKNMLMKTIAAVVCAVLVISVLAVMDVGRVRYSLYREIGIFAPNQTMQEPVATDPTEEPGATDPTEEPGATDPTEEPGFTGPTGNLNGPLGAEHADIQIERSDALRSALMREGLKQVKQNPVFGTGDLYYTYDLGYMKQNLTSHNFLIESIVSYGLIGLSMIAALFVAILLETKILCKAILTNWKRRLLVLIVMFYYFAFGMVQPSVYNTLLCPLFLLVISHFGFLIENTNTDPAVLKETGLENVAEE